MDQPFVTGRIENPLGEVPQVSSELTGVDRWGAIKARWGVGRMDFTVDPGLYALGHPDEGSPVLATANYKLSFDALRRALPGQAAWILVLDTRGINVWCAAGKGTFGTEELIGRIQSSGLERAVKHRKIILPQLSGPGVAAHQVKKLSGFQAVYGPVRARDLPAYLSAGCRATPEMRRKTFTLRERAVLIPVELVQALKPALAVMAAFFLLSGFGGAAGYWANLRDQGPWSILAILSALLAGAVLTPLLLPWVPGRAFSFKGWILGLVSVWGIILGKGYFSDQGFKPLEGLAWLLLMPAISAYLAMNFTGASTYTSLSGVKKEMRWAVPLEIALGAAGLILWIGTRFTI
ncbi:MAG: acetyl-CoA synthase subunit gamma [Deltaproteobacteria bacterium]|nr:acetyl-CoA synthase subunit gamma [Deltaproteobacteria bacterium]